MIYALIEASKFLVFITNFTLYENAEYAVQVSFERYKQTYNVGNYIECLHEIQSYAVLVRICFLKPYYNEYKFLGENVGAWYDEWDNFEWVLCKHSWDNEKIVIQVSQRIP